MIMSIGSGLCLSPTSHTDDECCFPQPLSASWTEEQQFGPSSQTGMQMALRLWHRAGGAKIGQCLIYAIKYLWRIRQLFYLFLMRATLGFAYLMAVSTDRLAKASIMRFKGYNAFFFMFLYASRCVGLASLKHKLYLNEKARRQKELQCDSHTCDKSNASLLPLSASPSNYCCGRNCRKLLSSRQLSFKYLSSVPFSWYFRFETNLLTAKPRGRNALLPAPFITPFNIILWRTQLSDPFHSFALSIQQKRGTWKTKK